MIWLKMSFLGAKKEINKLYYVPKYKAKRLLGERCIVEAKLHNGDYKYGSYYENSSSNCIFAFIVFVRIYGFGDFNSLAEV